MNRMLFSIWFTVSAMACPGCLGLTFGGKTTYVQPENQDTLQKLTELESRVDVLEHDRPQELLEIPSEKAQTSGPGFYHDR